MPSVIISVWMPRSRTPAVLERDADRVRHAADADLQAGAVLDLGGDMGGDLAIDVAGRRVADLRGRLAVPSTTKSTSLTWTPFCGP